MIDSGSCQIVPRYQTASSNNLTSRLIFGRLQTDKRLRKVIYFKTRNGSTEIGKVLKKGKCKVLIEHWTTTKTQNVPLEVVNKCKGCVLNILKDSQSCIGRFLKYAIIGAIPFSEKLKEKDQLLLPFSEIETLEHITTCSALKADWKRIEALTEETAWNSLTSDAKYKEKRKGIMKQFKLSTHHGSPSTSTKKKQPHKIDVGPHDGSGLGSSKVFINT
ncbi:2787_t:CDS:2, partial [Gigaspora margarita]